VEAPDVQEAGRRFLSSIAHHGLIEIEFKRDPRNGRLKLIDVNPRIWTWFGLVEAAGLDFGPMLMALAWGETPAPAGAPRIGTAWMYLPRDVFSVAHMLLKGTISPLAYLASLGRVRTWGVFSARDPLPALVDIPLGISRVFAKQKALRDE
jgi:predicted ATP-grasp superfamily ATP-dependent carboligase